MAAKLMTIAATFVHAPPGASSARSVLLPFPSMPWTAHEFAAGTASSGSTRAFTTIDRRCGRKAWSGRLRYTPSNRPPILPTDRKVSIDTILQSTRFPASGEIAHSLIIAVSAMCQTKSLVTYVSRSTESGHSAGHRVVRVHHRIVRSGFAVVSVDSSPTHEHQRAVVYLSGLVSTGLMKSTAEDLAQHSRGVTKGRQRYCRYEMIGRPFPTNSGKGRSSDSRCRSATVSTNRCKYAAVLTTERGI